MTPLKLYIKIVETNNRSLIKKQFTYGTKNNNYIIYFVVTKWQNISISFFFMWYDIYENFIAYIFIFFYFKILTADFPSIFQQHARIVNGFDTKGPLPYQLILHHRTTKCGATLISSKYAIAYNAYIV